MNSAAVAGSGFLRQVYSAAFPAISCAAAR